MTSSDEEELGILKEELPAVLQVQKEKWLKSANIPPKFRAVSFDSFERAKQPRAFDAVKSHEWDMSLLLYSPEIYGLGKTHLLCAMANHQMESGEPATISAKPFPRIVTALCPVYYTTEASLLSQIKATFNRKGYEDEDSEEAIFRRLSNVKVLILDDIGKVRPRDLNFLQGVYFRIIDDRYLNEKPMAIAVNLSLDNLESHIGGASADRLLEMCGKNGFIKMTGQSYRKGGKNELPDK